MTPIEPNTIVKVMERGGIHAPDGAYVRKIRSMSCIFPEAHRNGDVHKSAWLDGPGNVYGCPICGIFTAKGMAERLKVAWPLGNGDHRPIVAAPLPSVVRAAVKVGIETPHPDSDPALVFLRSRGLADAATGPDPVAVIWPDDGAGVPEPYADLARRGYRVAARLYDARTGALASLQARWTGTGDSPDGKKTLFPPGANQAAGKVFANLPAVAMIRGTAATPARRVIVGEGLTDFLGLHLAFPDVPVVCPAGASVVAQAFNPPPRWMRAGMEIISAVDGDEPGEAGAQALAVACRTAGALVRRVKFPEGTKDIGDIIRDRTIIGVRVAVESAEFPAAIRQFGKSARPLQEYRMTRLETPPSVIGDGLLRIRQFGLLFGAPGGGKSWAAMDLAVSVAAGRDWFNIPVRRGRAGYLSLELERWDLTSRFDAILETRGLTEDDIEDRLSLISPPDWDDAFDITNPDHLIALQVWIQTNRLDLAIVDTLSRAHTADEKDLRPVSQAALDIVRRTNSALLFVHHPRKPGQPAGPGQARPAVMYEARGDSRLLGDARFIVSLTARRKVLQLTVEKTNTGRPLPPCYLKPNDRGVLEVTELPMTKQEQAAANRERILAALDDADDGATRSGIVAVTGIPEDQVKRALASLVKSGDLEVSGKTSNRIFTRAIDVPPENHRPSQQGIDFVDSEPF